MEKKIADKEIMAQLLEALEIKAYPFSKKLEDVKQNTIYNVLQSVHGISQDLRHKILKSYPNVNPAFIAKGIYPIFKDPSLKTETHTSDQQLSDILSVPERLANIEYIQKRIEEKLDHILYRLTNQSITNK